MNPKNWGWSFPARRFAVVAALIALSLAPLHAGGDGVYLWSLQKLPYRAFYGTCSEFPSNEVSSIVEGENGDIYVGTFDSGILKFTWGERQWEALPQKDGLPPYNNVHHLVWNAQAKEIVAATNGGVIRVRVADQFSDSEVTVIRKADDSINLSLVHEGDGRYWIGTSRGLLNPSGTRFTQQDGLGSDQIQCLALADGKLWIGTTQGFSVRVGETFGAVGVGSETFSNWVNGVTVSRSPLTSAFPEDRIEFIIESLLAGADRRPEADPENPRPNPKPDRKDFLDALQVEKDELLPSKLRAEKERVFVAANTGFFETDIWTRNMKELLDRWATAVFSDEMGRTYFSTKEQEILPSSRNSRVYSSFTMGTRIRAYIAGLIKGELDNSGVSTGLVPLPTIQELRKKSEPEQDAWLESWLQEVPVTSINIGRRGTFWIGLKGAGLFRIEVADLVGELFSGAMCRQKRYLGGKRKQFCLETPAMSGPPTSDTTEGIDKVRSTYTGKESTFGALPRKIWVGRCSELQKNDWKRVGEFLGQYGDPVAILHLLASLPQDPLIFIPFVGLEEGVQLLQQMKEEIPQDREKLKTLIEEKVPLLPLPNGNSGTGQ